MDLRSFVEQFFSGMASRGVRFCVLRNHAGLPDTNDGADIDLLVSPKQVDLAMTLLRSMPNVRVVAVAGRDYVVSAFVDGVSFNGRAILEVDFVTRLYWKGIDYLDPEAVLDRRAPRAGGPDWLFVPAPQDEALVSLFASYLVGGFVKERYMPEVRATIAARPQATIDALVPTLGENMARRLAGAVGDGEDAALMRLLPALRSTLRQRSFARRPLATAGAMLRYAVTEVVAWRRNARGYRLCVLGPDGSGKSTALEGILPRLEEACKEVRLRHLKPTLVGKSRVASRGVVTDPHKLPARGLAGSTAKILFWLGEAWVDALRDMRPALSIQVFDRYFHDILVDPRRYRYGGSRGVARFIARLMPQPDLLLILDAPAATVQARKQEVTPEETARQRGAYLQLAGSMQQARVIDAAQPIDMVRAQMLELILRDMTRYFSRAR